MIKKCPCGETDLEMFTTANYYRCRKCVRQYNKDNKEAIAKKQKQYYIDNKESLNAKQKQYNKDNKEVIAKKKKQYREENKETLSKKQKYYNKVNATARKQYYIDNKESLNAKKKQYREENKEAIAKKKKQYREENKEAIAKKQKQYSISNKDKKQQYYIDNKESLNAKQKQYREENKEAIAEKKKQYREVNNLKIANKKISQGNKGDDYIFYVLHFQSKIDSNISFFKYGQTKFDVKSRFHGYKFNITIIKLYYGEKDFIGAIETKVLYETQSSLYSLPVDMKFYPSSKSISRELRTEIDLDLVESVIEEQNIILERASKKEIATDLLF